MAVFGTASAFVALLAWTAAVIYYIDTTYKPNMGFWAVILIGLSVVFSIPLCVVVFRLSFLASYRVMFAPYVIAILILIAVLCFSIPFLEWARSLEPSLIRTYTSLLALMFLPPMLIGFIVAGISGWIDSILYQAGGEPSVATEAAS